jgi:hypothetical protein
MASRAATLVKPKPKVKSKPKAAAKSIAAKPLVAKSSASAKSSATTPASKASTATSKAAASKAPASKAPIAKASLVKPTALKPALGKVAKPSALGKTGALKTKSNVVPGDDAVMIGGTASFESAAPKPRRRSKSEIRTRIYWAVFNQALRRVAVFEFDQRGEAEKRAAKLAKMTGDHHFIQKIKAIVQ